MLYSKLNEFIKKGSTKAVFLIVAGIFAALALAGTPTVFYWLAVWGGRSNYRVATLTVQNVWLSNPQRNFNRFWILDGLVEGQNERLVVPFNKTNRLPFAPGDSLQIRYNPDRARVDLAGRNLRTVALDEYSTLQRTLIVSAVGLYGPIISLGLLWVVRRVGLRSLTVSNKYQFVVQICAIAVVFGAGGCKHSRVPAAKGLERLSDNLKVFYERGDTNGLVAQASTNGVPFTLSEAMKQSLLIPMSFGKVEVQSG